VNLPSPPSLRVEDFPDVPPALLSVLNQAFLAIYDAVSVVPELGEAVDLTFMSAASGNSSAEVKITTSSRPQHVKVTMLRRDDGTDLTSPWSFTWSLGTGTVKLSFQGLPASVKHRFSLEYR